MHVRSSSRRVAPALAPALALTVALALTGCSGDSAARGQLSQSAGSAASATRSAALVLGLQEGDRLIPGVEDTGLSSAAQTLATEAGSVAIMSAIGGIGEQRDQILSDVRDAQDTLARAQRVATEGQDDHAGLDELRTRLDRLAEQLDAAAKKLESAG
ncbi:hypothetical protein P5G50_02355 [Leifsonia sp. F6_8S_P_1B]|uniref:Uncharacterized protein n=1 Tax=Leifsonia williamsii TaxID=3035919 RepID=A0ABT8K748_9MICO|nr:hypothetical protein [Leifsonia williamsii]MDN4613283.1 hypothetical protein [Leifsonia williamsii]